MRAARLLLDLPESPPPPRRAEPSPRPGPAPARDRLADCLLLVDRPPREVVDLVVPAHRPALAKRCRHVAGWLKQLARALDDVP